MDYGEYLSFLELLAPQGGETPDQTQRRAHLLFGKRVEDSPFSLWQPGDPIDPSGLRILVGVADSYSSFDLLLLDALAQIYRESALAVSLLPKIDVFSVCDLELDDIARFVPRIGTAFETPIVGLWRRGSFTQGAWGLKSLEVLETAMGRSLPRPNRGESTFTIYKKHE